MATTSTFVVDKKTKKISPATEPSHEYWQGKKKGTIDMMIEVFGDNHLEHAKEIYEALKKAGLTEKYFKIIIEPKPEPIDVGQIINVLPFVRDVVCIKSLYKSTYKKNAFIKGRRYTVTLEDEYIWVRDEKGHSFSFSKDESLDMYHFDEYFK